MRTLLNLLIIVHLIMALFASAAHAQNPTYLKWREYESEHFIIYYPEGQELTAYQALHIAERVYGSLASMYGTIDSKISIVIKDDEDFANGGAFFYDNKVEISATSLDYEFRSYSDWLWNVVTHELTHIFSIRRSMKAPRRIPMVYYQHWDYQEEKREDVLIGYPNVLVSYPIPMFNIPAWLAEGVAQFQAQGVQYDRWDTHRDMILRQAALNDKLLTIEEMSVFNWTGLGNEMVYDHGFSLVRFIAEEYGEEKITEILRAMSSSTAVTFGIACKRALGISSDELYDHWKDSLKRHYTAVLDSLGELTEGTLFRTGGFLNGFPTWSPDGSRLAYVSNRGLDYGLRSCYVANLNPEGWKWKGKDRAFRKLRRELEEDIKNARDTEEIEKLKAASKGAFDIAFAPGIQSSPVWLDEWNVLYNQRMPADKYGSHWWDMYRYVINTEDPRKGTKTRITHNLRGTYPDLSPDTSKKETKQLRKKIELEENINKLKRLKEILNFLDNYESDEQELNSLKAFKNNQIIEFDILEKSLNNQKSEKMLIKRNITKKSEKIESALINKDSLINKQESVRALSDLASNVIDMILTSFDNPKLKTKVSWNYTFIFIGCIILTCGLIAAAFFTNMVVRIVALIVCTLCCVFFTYNAKKTNFIVDEQENKLLLNKFLDEWNNNPLSHNLQCKSLDDLYDALHNLKNAYNDLMFKISETNEIINELQKSLNSHSKDLRKKNENIQAYINKKENWLNERNINNRNEYIKNINKFNILNKRLNQSKEMLNEYMQEEECTNLVELRLKCERKLNDFEKKGIPKQGKTELDINASKSLKNKLVFVKNGAGLNNLFILNRDDNSQKQLTFFDDGTRLYRPRWSPDGEHIVFSIQQGSDVNIAMIDKNGSDFRYIVTSPGQDRDPAWSSDGSAIYFSSDMTGIPNIYRIDISTGTVYRVTNVLGGAFSPAPSPCDTTLAFSHYGPDGFEIRLLRLVDELPVTDSGVFHTGFTPPRDRNYERFNTEESRPYTMKTLDFTYMPRIVNDRGNVKLGTYLMKNEVINNGSFLFGGALSPSNRDSDLFALFEYKKFIPTVFVEMYRLTRSVGKNENFMEEFGTVIRKRMYNLNEFDLGMRYIYHDKHTFESRMIYSRYNAKVEYTHFLTGRYIHKPYYTYSHGLDLALIYRQDSTAPARDSDINPRGRHIHARYDRAINFFLDDFEYVGFLREKYNRYPYNTFFLNWVEHIPVPRTQKHTLNLRGQVNLIDRMVDDFYELQLGGPWQMRGYTFYSLSGRKNVMAQALYRFPVWYDMRKNLGFWYFNNIYMGLFADIGRAWNKRSLNWSTSGFKRDTGVEIRIDAFSFYNFPTRIECCWAYGMDDTWIKYFDTENSQLVWKRDDQTPWKFYFNVLFGFN